MPRNRNTCADCPKRAANGCCLLYAKPVVPRHPVCEYGRVAIHNERMKRRQRVLAGKPADGSQTKFYAPRGWKIKTQKTQTRKGSRYEDD